MPAQTASEATTAVTASTIKRSGIGESPDTHEYTICLLGDWSHTKTSKTKSNADNSAHASAVHEIEADFDSPIVQVSCGSGWSCLLCEDGRAYSFGDNTYGQLGQDHERPHVTAPMPMSAPFCLQPRRRILRLSCGSAHGGFVLDAGDLYMFGCGSYGRLGTGDEDNTSIPTMVKMKWSTLLAAASGPVIHRKTQSTVVTVEDDDEVRFTDVSCGDRHTLVLAARTQRGNSDSRRTTTKSKTSIISFGDGMNGRLGVGDEKDRHEGALLTTWLAASNVPGVGIAGNNGCMTPPTITAICAGSTHNLALSATGDVFSWGNGVDGQLGHGAAVSEWVPRQIAFFKDLAVTAIGCGTAHSTATSRTGVIYTWGRGAEGQLGLDLEGDCTVDAVDKSVWVPHPVGILKGSAHRVTVRTMVAKRNMTLAIDDRDRMFVWGDNALEQLGLPLSVNTEHGTKSFLPRPRLLAYMDLRAPKSAACGSPSSSLSRVSSLRELVAAAKPDPIRLGLAHVEAGDRFTMLVFTTKPGISSSSNSETRETNSRTSPEVSPEPKGGNASVSKWNFSLVDELLPSAIPSREPAYYQFMVNYKVYIRPTVIKARDDDEESEADRELQRRSPRRRECRRSTLTRRGTPISTESTTTPEIRGCSTNNDDQVGNVSVSNSPAHVQGFDSWLDKRLNSPSKANMTGHSFANTPRFSPQSSKEEETRSASCSNSTKDNETSWMRTPARFPTKPQKPKSSFGRSLSTRRPTAFTRAPSSKKNGFAAGGSLPTKLSSNQESSPKQNQAKNSPLVIVPFGSSVESRFGATSSSSSSASTPIYPEKCSLRDRKAPQFTIGGGAEHFSLVVSRRLHHAKGTGPGPGTYDRHGG
ncbi:hypothetical protein PR003_g12066 [Phytophthora rubi]|uniref:Uncharacterized protein n=1 Tax=Phytophthora rubi TaxID=129364 RepID=A0A6A4FDS5_9STRA|nr:hypothetical protein PR003_g12066 [Phytophthora rubi]